MWWPLFIHTFCFIHFTTKLKRHTRKQRPVQVYEKDRQNFLHKTDEHNLSSNQNQAVGVVSLFALEGRILGSCWGPSIFQTGISQSRTVYDSLGVFHRRLLLFSAQKFTLIVWELKMNLDPWDASRYEPPEEVPQPGVQEWRSGFRICV